MRRNAGSVFVITLAVLAGLVALVAALAASERESAHVRYRRLEDRRARIMAEAAVQHAVAVLQQMQEGPAEKKDGWATAGSSGAVAYEVSTDSYRFQILDAGSRININTATEDQLKRLPLTADQVSAILDWRESTPTPRAAGAKDEYYHSLENPYNAKLKDFDSVDELLLVKGFTPTLLFGQVQSDGTVQRTSGFSADMLTTNSLSADKDPSGKDKVNLASATVTDLTALGMSTAAANALVQSRPTTLGDALKLPNAASAARTIADSTTVNTDKQQKGLINVNTASEAVLASLPGVEADVAAAIVSRQSVGFKSLGDLLDVPGVNPSVLALFVDRVCVGAKSFIVRSQGISGGSIASIEAAVHIDTDGQVQTDSVRVQPLADMGRYWDWETDATSTVDMGGG